MAGREQVTFRMTRNRFPAVTAQVNARAELLKKKLTAKIAERARERVRVRTGATRASITETDEGVEASEAAGFLEFGTYKMPAYPFLGPSVDDSAGEFKAEVKALFKGIA